jgi:hypothetical protein
MTTFNTTPAELRVIPFGAESVQPSYAPPPSTRLFRVPREIRFFFTDEAGTVYSAERTPGENPTDYGFDWGTEWLPEGVSITSSTWTITPVSSDTTTLMIASSAFNLRTTTVWISGGINAELVRVTNHITTDSDPLPLGQERTFELLVVAYR